VKYRYFDTLDFAAYEPQVQKLIDKHISTDGEGFGITDRLDLFDTEKLEAEAAKTKGKAATADHKASKTMRAIEVRTNEDPVYYKKLAQLLRETIEAYHQQRYLKQSI
jgi:type I restriction enzyme R subunit